MITVKWSYIGLSATIGSNDIIKAAIPMKVRATGGHPSKRTYQAIRIELNRELEVLENSIDMMIDRLNKEGRLCIITFHSLEDRIVKVRIHVRVRQVFQHVCVERSLRGKL